MPKINMDIDTETNRIYAINKLMVNPKGEKITFTSRSVDGFSHDFIIFTDKSGTTTIEIDLGSSKIPPKIWCF